jgi:hypothetical protein
VEKSACQSSSSAVATDDAFCDNAIGGAGPKLESSPRNPGGAAHVPQLGPVDEAVTAMEPRTIFDFGEFQHELFEIRYLAQNIGTGYPCRRYTEIVDWIMEPGRYSSVLFHRTMCLSGQGRVIVGDECEIVHGVVSLECVSRSTDSQLRVPSRVRDST